MLDVPSGIDDLTPAWLTSAVTSRCPGAVVESVELGSVVDGTNRRASVKLAYSRGAGPESVFVKAHGRMLHRLALVALRALTAEARLADSGVPMPIESPTFYAGGWDAARLATIVVMEDVTARGARPNDATTALTVAEVRNGLAGLARLHAAYWDARLPPALRFLRPWRLTRSWAPVSALNIARALRRLDSAGLVSLVPRYLNVADFERQFRRSATVAGSGPQTMLHGDPHPGNTYTLPGPITGFYDWQLVRTGNWSHDVGYFLAGSLDVTERRANEKDLLLGYLECLREQGVDAPAAGKAWDLYRATPAFGLGTWLHTVSVGSFQPFELCIPTLKRFAAAYDDLETHRSLAAAAGE